MLCTIKLTEVRDRPGIYRGELAQELMDTRRWPTVPVDRPRGKVELYDADLDGVALGSPSPIPEAVGSLAEWDRHLAGLGKVRRVA